MQPNRFGELMRINQFWSSVWAVILYLLGIGLLQYILTEAVTLFGLLPYTTVTLPVNLIAAVTPIVGTLTYVAWRWDWQPAKVGLNRGVRAGGWVGAGAGIGIITALLTLFLTWLFGGQIAVSVRGWNFLFTQELIFYILFVFGVELVFRGTVISRYQTDLAHREVAVLATLTPFGWKVLQGFLGLPGPATGLDSAWMAAMSVVLSLLFLRTDSVWFTAGIRLGMTGALLITGNSFKSVESGGLIVWGVTAAILLALEWHKQQGFAGGRMAGRGSRVIRGRTVRGPWGPH